MNVQKNPAVSKMNMGPNIRPMSRMKNNQPPSGQGSALKQMSAARNGPSQDASDDDYEEDFQDNAVDDGQDEMEKIRQAMAREKKKADRFQERQMHREKEEQ